MADSEPVGRWGRARSPGARWLGTLALASVLCGLALALSLVLAGCQRDASPGLDRGPTTTDERESDQGRGDEPRRGGSVRVAVWAEPDPASAASGSLRAAPVRSLVLPQLFVVGPDGEWQASLVEPGSDRTGPGDRSASFRLRAGAVWSNGTPITADDLRRLGDPEHRAVAAARHLVERIDGPDDGGVITVRFTEPLPGWRMLWSGLDAVEPPLEGVWGGPFVVAERTPGLETVLHRNPDWWGRGPWLDEVRLVLVPSAAMAIRLLERGEIDVVMPMASTGRRRALDDLDGVEVEVAVAGEVAGAWSVQLVANPDRLETPAERRALLALADPERFVATLLRGEAEALGAAVDADAGVLSGRTVTVVSFVEEPMTPLLERALQRRAREAGVRLELRTAVADITEPWLAAGDYGAAIAVRWDPPAGAVASALVSGAASDVSLPLWRPVTVVAWRTTVGLRGVEPNPWALSAAWNAWEWSLG